MGEEDQELMKHVCKFCTKSFPCGRSLGGHMRSHMMSSSAKAKAKAKAEAEEKLHKKKLVDAAAAAAAADVVVNGEEETSKNTFMVGFEVNGHVGYGLRENPKKSWRLSDSSEGTSLNHQGKVCKECGKGFQSWKALFGHMRCHSDRDKVSSLEEEEEDDSWTDENQKLIMDSHSDNEAAAAPSRRRRSSRRRYKITTTTAATTTTTTTSSSLSLVNASTSASEIEQEQDVALCLMMLSRDVRYLGGGFSSSAADFSDNDSVALEVRSSGLVKQTADKQKYSNGDKFLKVMKKKRAKKLESVVSVSENFRFEVKRSEFELKIAESDVSVHGFVRESSVKKTKPDFGAGFEVLDADKSRGKCNGTELIKDLIKEADDQADSLSVKYTTTPSKRTEEYGGSNSSKKRKFVDSGSEGWKITRKSHKYECTTCKKNFHSYQALGGHRASHKRMKGCSLLKTESSTENSIDTTDMKSVRSCNNDNTIEKEEDGSVVEASLMLPKSTKHECPICFKVFSSGQALGGHKRSHMIESSEVRRSTESILIHQKLPEIEDLLDLNLPAPIEEDTKDHHIGFKPWWVGSNQKHKAAPVGMISH